MQDLALIMSVFCATLLIVMFFIVLSNGAPARKAKKEEKAKDKQQKITDEQLAKEFVTVQSEQGPVLISKLMLKNAGFNLNGATNDSKPKEEKKQQVPQVPAIPSVKPDSPYVEEVTYISDERQDKIIVSVENTVKIVYKWNPENKRVFGDGAFKTLLESLAKKHNGSTEAIASDLTSKISDPYFKVIDVSFDKKFEDDYLNARKSDLKKDLLDDRDMVNKHFEKVQEKQDSRLLEMQERKTKMSISEKLAEMIPEEYLASLVSNESYVHRTAQKGNSPKASNSNIINVQGHKKEK